MRSIERTLTRFAVRAAALAVLVAAFAAPSTAAGSWTLRVPLPSARAGLAIGEIGGLLYAVGSNLSSANEAYDPVGDSWVAKAPLPTPRSLRGSNAAVVDGVLYVIGGNPTGFCSGTNEAYNPATNAWTTRASMPTARCHLSVAALGGRVYAVGGTVGSGALALVQIYDPATNAWSSGPAMPSGRIDFALSAVNGRLYAVGGLTNVAETAVVEVYDPATNAWTTKAPMPTARSGLALAEVDGLLYAIGGVVNSTNTYVATVESYDPTTDTWTAETPMAAARAYLASGVVNGVVYAVGGGDAIGAVATNESFTPSSFNALPVADAGDDRSLDATSADGAEVSLDGTGSIDPEGDALTYVWNVSAGVTLDDPTSATPTGTFPVGVHMVTLSVSDGRGGFDTDDVVVQVQDAAPPSVLCTTDVASLWPPDHRTVDVEVRIVASDTISDPDDLVLLSVTVTSDESDDAAGDGDGATTGDAHGQDGFAQAVDVTSSFAFDATTAAFVGTVTLRAERSGTGDGRSYGLVAVVEDASGNATTASCVVVVPHSRRR